MSYYNKIPIKSVFDDRIILVNNKQFFRILKRRAFRSKFKRNVSLEKYVLL